MCDDLYRSILNRLHSNLPTLLCSKILSIRREETFYPSSQSSGSEEIVDCKPLCLTKQKRGREQECQVFVRSISHLFSKSSVERMLNLSSTSAFI